MYGYLSKESLVFLELVCLDKRQYDFCFILKTLNSQKTLWTCEIMHNFGGKKGNTLVVSWVKVVLSVLFA